MFNLNNEDELQEFTGKFERMENGGTFPVISISVILVPKEELTKEESQRLKRSKSITVRGNWIEEIPVLEDAEIVGIEE